MRIGIVGLDTSHPANWIPIERELGHEVVGLWDGGDVHPPGYAASFARDHGIPRVFRSVEEMVPEVDCAILHTCDWDKHVSHARPFVESGKSVLVDKPIAGNLRDLNQFRQWESAGARITGGSSLRFCGEVRDWLEKPVRERGRPHTVFCGCGVDDFNYGIHAYALLCAVLGVGIRSVRHVGAGVQRRIQVNAADGRIGFLVIGQAEEWLPFYATVITEKSVTYLQPDPSALYRSLLEGVLPFLAGETDDPPLAFDRLVEPELCALAARRSWLDGNREVGLAELSPEDPGYDGSRFAGEYRKMRYPSS